MSIVIVMYQKLKSVYIFRNNRGKSYDNMVIVTNCRTLFLNNM